MPSIINKKDKDNFDTVNSLSHTKWNLKIKLRNIQKIEILLAKLKYI